jgi:O-antigen/teichoic acid export membrane protein
LLGGVLSGVLGFVVVVVISRGLGASGAGAFLEAVALFTILSNAAEAGADTGLVRTVSRFLATGRVADVRPLLRIALVPVLAVSSLMAVAVLVWADPLSRLLLHGASADSGALYMRVLAPFLPFGAAATVLASGTRGFGPIGPYVLLEDIVKPGLRLPFVLVAILGSLGAVIIAAGWAVPVGLEFVLGMVIILRMVASVERQAGTFEKGGTGTGRAGIAGEFWRFSAPRAAAGIFQIAIVWLDVLLVGALRNTRDAGIYGATSRLLVAGSFAVEAIRIAIAPQISGMLAREDRAAARQVYRVGTWWVMALAWPIYIVVGIFAPLLLSLFGSDFVAGSSALEVLAAAMLLGLATGNVTTVLLMGGKSSWNLLNTLAALVVNIALNLVLIPRLGILGAAIAWASSIAVNNLAPLVQVKRFLGLDPFGRGFLLVALSAVGCFGLPGLLVRLTAGARLAAFIPYAVVATAAYVALLHRWRAQLHLGELAVAWRRRLRS